MWLKDDGGLFFNVIFTQPNALLTVAMPKKVNLTYSYSKGIILIPGHCSLINICIVMFTTDYSVN